MTDETSIVPPGSDPNPPAKIGDADALEGKRFALFQIKMMRKQLDALEKCLRRQPDWKLKKPEGKGKKKKKK